MLLLDPSAHPLGPPTTVGIPVYNGERYLAACLESLAGQSDGDFTAIVVDNASTDRTGEICRDFGDARFRYVRNERNVGALANHNRALSLVRSPYVKLLSADDILLPDTLQLQRAQLDTDKSVGLVTCDCIVTDAELAPVSTTRYLSGRRTGAAVVKACVDRVDNLIGGPSNTMLRMAAVGDMRFDARYTWLADLEFHCRLLRHTDYLNIDQPGFYYRRHAATDSTVGCPPDIRRHDETLFLRDHARSPLPWLRVLARRTRQALKA